MPGINALVTAISNAVVSDLASGGQLPLTPNLSGAPGAILLGPHHDFANSDAPRIIFTPTKSSFGPKSIAAPTTLRPMTERVIGTEIVHFQVRVWGRGVVDTTGGTLSSADYDATQILYQSLYGQVHALCAGNYEWSSLTWTDITLHTRRGREAVIDLALHTPIYARTALQNLASPVPGPNPPSNYVPAGTVRNETITFTNPGGTSGTQTIP